MVVGVRLVEVLDACWRGRVHGRSGVAGEPVLILETESCGVVAANMTSPHSSSGCWQLWPNIVGGVWFAIGLVSVMRGVAVVVVVAGVDLGVGCARAVVVVVVVVRALFLNLCLRRSRSFSIFISRVGFVVGVGVGVGGPGGACDRGGFGDCARGGAVVDAVFGDCIRSLLFVNRPRLLRRSLSICCARLRRGVVVGGGGVGDCCGDSVRD